MKNFLVSLSWFLFVIVMVMFFSAVTACGEAPETLSSGQEVLENPDPVITEPAPEDPGPAPAPVVVKHHSGGGGGSSAENPPEPGPECVEASDCGVNFACNEGKCEDLEPECIGDDECEANEFCDLEYGVCIQKPAPVACESSENCPVDQNCNEGTCNPKSCEIDDDCTSPNSCNEGICRPKHCAVPKNTIDPSSLVVHESCGETEEEVQAEIDFTIGQLERAYPDLELISEALKACEIEDTKPEIQDLFDNLDAVRILLDNHLSECNNQQQGE